MSVFDDTSRSPSLQYDPASWGEDRQYVHHSSAGDLRVSLWTHSGTAWVSLRGPLNRRAARALAMVLIRTHAAAIVLNTAELTLPPASGGTPLVTLCATLSHAGYSVAVVDHDDETDADAAAAAAAASGGELGLLMVTSA